MLNIIKSIAYVLETDPLVYRYYKARESAGTQDTPVDASFFKWAYKQEKRFKEELAEALSKPFSSLLTLKDK